MGKYIEVQILNLMEEHKEELYNAFTTENKQKKANPEIKRNKNKRSPDDPEDSGGSLSQLSRRSGRQTATLWIGTGIRS